MQFARDAHQAEGWLYTQEPYLKKEDEKTAVRFDLSIEIVLSDILRLFVLGKRV